MALEQRLETHPILDFFFINSWSEMKSDNKYQGHQVRLGIYI